MSHDCNPDVQLPAAASGTVQSDSATNTQGIFTEEELQVHHPFMHNFFSSQADILIRFLLVDARSCKFV
jgi:hypothetical protein